MATPKSPSLSDLQRWYLRSDAVLDALFGVPPKRGGGKTSAELGEPLRSRFGGYFMEPAYLSRALDRCQKAKDPYEQLLIAFPRERANQLLKLIQELRAATGWHILDQKLNHEEPPLENRLALNLRHGTRPFKRGKDFDELFEIARKYEAATTRDLEAITTIFAEGRLQTLDNDLLVPREASDALCRLLDAIPGLAGRWTLHNHQHDQEHVYLRVARRSPSEPQSERTLTVHSQFRWTLAVCWIWSQLRPPNYKPFKIASP